MAWGKGISKIGEVAINIKESLMASSILGNTIPLNSAPIWHKSYLNLTLREESSTISCNAFHLSTLANTTLQQVANVLMKALKFYSETDSQILQQYHTKITNLLNDNNYSEINEM